MSLTYSYDRMDIVHDLIPLARLESELSNHLDFGEDIIFESMRYSVLRMGKRLRPALCIASCAMAGGDPEDVLGIACACEMIHTASLMMDDLPCMDNDALRRGAPTNHVVFGEATTMLAASDLTFRAIQAAARSQHVPCTRRIAIIEELTQAAQAMARGQLAVWFWGSRALTEALCFSTRR